MPLVLPLPLYSRPSDSGRSFSVLKPEFHMDDASLPDHVAVASSLLTSLPSRFRWKGRPSTRRWSGHVWPPRSVALSLGWLARRTWIELDLPASCWICCGDMSKAPPLVIGRSGWRWCQTRVYVWPSYSMGTAVATSAEEEAIRLR